MVETKTTSQMPLGTWGKLSTEDHERVPKINFEINIPVVVEFMEDEPNEFTGQDGGAFYLFNVKVGNELKVISTSAWTLLREIKKHSPIKGKKLSIVKKITKGKQGFEATLIV